MSDTFVSDSEMQGENTKHFSEKHMWPNITKLSENNNCRFYGVSYLCGLCLYFETYIWEKYTVYIYIIVYYRLTGIFKKLIHF